ncbi:uncharacterized protein LOC128721620 [Anopheles nili]|uniref:uncharacterized protein LOC128721620 n=1 Tax=Anopheles nili TaxID=185578 RepID=UPI00237A9975|nr:uncharacterized protein LOC128721620 [Anopheles nili]
MDTDAVVYISNIPKQTTAAELHNFLRSSGNVVGSTFMRENRNDCRTKIAFVMFENAAQAMEACSLDQTLFQSHRLSILLSNDDRKFLAGYTIVIQNTSSDTSEEDLFEACCKYGNVEAVQIPTNYYAFVGFAERSAAHAAQRKLDNSLLKQHTVTVKVIDEDVRVRLEDLDSYKTPRVYNELLRAKQQYYDNASKNSKDVQHNAQPRRDQCDQISDQRYYDNVDDDSMCQFNVNDSNNYQPTTNQHFYEEEYNPVLFYRRDVRFGKPRFISANKLTVKVENIPRDTYDEDVIMYFQNFGPIRSIEKGISLNAIFTKVYMIMYHDEESYHRALNCIRRQVQLSNITCTIFVTIPGEALQPLKSQSVLVSYISSHVLYDEIAQAFANIGDVLYVEKKVRNNGPTILHFAHPVNMVDACQINCIAGYKVAVQSVNQKGYLKFTSNLLAFKKAAKTKLKGTDKGNYLANIEAKEEEEKTNNIAFKTGHDPHYHNPNQKKYSFEVVLYNCPKDTKFGHLKSYFKRAGNILAMRHEPSKFDANTWKVYVSFSNYLEAFRAIRLKGKFNGELIFKHIAAESPKLDCVETLMVKVLSEENITVARIARGFIGCGGLYFAEKVGTNEFIVIFRDLKGAQKACLVKSIDRQPIEVYSMKDMITKRYDPQRTTITKDGTSNVDGEDGEPKQDRRRVLLSDMFSDMEADNHAPTVQQTSPKPEQKTIEIKQGRSDIPKASTSNSQQIQNATAGDLRNVIAEKRHIKSDCQEKLNDLEVMERYIKEKEQEIQRRLEKLKQDEANVKALLPSSSKQRSSSPEARTKEIINAGTKINISTERSSPVRMERISVKQHFESQSSRTTDERTNTRPAVSNVTYPIKQLIVSEQTRSVSPSDCLAHERYMQIRVEKIAITQELDSLRQRFDYRKGSRVEALKDLLAELNREQRDIQIQLEVKQRLRMPDNVNYTGSSFDASPSPPSQHNHDKRSLSRSRSPYRSASRTRSRSRSKPRNIARSRSRSPLRRSRMSRSSSPQYSRSKRRRTRSPTRDSRSSTPKRGYSLERDIYNIGRYNANHGKHSIYVGNVNFKVSEREIEDRFARYGRLENIDFSRRKRYGEIYFNYENRQHAFEALKMNNIKIAGRRLRVAFNMEKPSNREKYSLYFKIRQPTEEDTIFRSYKSFGEIDFIWYPEHGTFGTISFRRTEVATAALSLKQLIDGTQIYAKPFIDKLRRFE